MRFHRLGASIFVFTAPLFLLIQLVVGLRWRDPPFSWAVNNVSDLGNVGCGPWDATRPRVVCSPWHTLMNGGMVTTGVLLAAAVLMTWSALGGTAAAVAARLLILATAGGWVLAGAFPADINENNHFLGALLIFVLGNLAMLVAALSRSGPVLPGMRIVSLALGVLGVAGMLLFLAQAGVGIGVGGMERVAAFALPAWTVVAGVRVMAATQGFPDRQPVEQDASRANERQPPASVAPAAPPRPALPA